MMKVTIKPKDGKPVVKRFRTPQEAVVFINSYARAADASQACANFKKARDGKCYNCGFDEESHR
jgi:hypothetical protein